jgi:hypothetical protein
MYQLLFLPELGVAGVVAGVVGVVVVGVVGPHPSKQTKFKHKRYLG